MHSAVYVTHTKVHHRCGVVFFYFRVLFICDANFNYVLDKCRVLNEIIEPAIVIFKINTNIISNTRLRRNLN